MRNTPEESDDAQRDLETVGEREGFEHKSNSETGDKCAETSRTELKPALKPGTGSREAQGRYKPGITGITRNNTPEALSPPLSLFYLGFGRGGGLSAQRFLSNYGRKGGPFCA